MMKPWLAILLAGCTIGSTACNIKEPYTPIGKVLGYKPVYSTATNLYTIQSMPVRGVSRPGKIYVKDTLIFQNEIGEGFHIINNSNPANAQRVGFISVKGSEEISIKENFLYTNNFTDLVVINISTFTNATEVSRTKNAFFSGNTQLAPPVSGGFFECVDASKGQVISWIKDSIINPKCSN